MTTRIDQIMPECIRFDYAGNVAWTTANAAGGVSCAGNTVQIDWGTANRGALGGMRGKTPPAACGPQMPVPSGPPPAATGPTVKIYYDKTVDMATAPLLSATADCYQVRLEGNSAWFPSSALGYRTEFYGNPVGLDYKARRSMPCGVEPTPAKPPAPPPPCLVVNPAPTSAMITYGGKIPPIKTTIDQIMPKCIRFSYAGNPIWTTANAAGGISCAGNTVQIDWSTAGRVFSSASGTTPPAACK